jgi:hypothetical protein
MTRRPRVPRADPARLEVEGETFKRELQAEAERSLAKDPERRRHTKAGDPDPLRSRVPRPDQRRRRP